MKDNRNISDDRTTQVGCPKYVRNKSVMLLFNILLFIIAAHSAQCQAFQLNMHLFNSVSQLQLSESTSVSGYQHRLIQSEESPIEIIHPVVHMSASTHSLKFSRNINYITESFLLAQFQSDPAHGENKPISRYPMAISEHSFIGKLLDHWLFAVTTVTAVAILKYVVLDDGYEDSIPDAPSHPPFGNFRPSNITVYYR